ncbi:MAG: transporter [Haloplasmataceae bacterium]|jgi:iron complex transport system ATP-binding protein|nr:transporter [Haloplasmataceae bacterium]
MILKAKQVTLGYKNNIILKDLNLIIPEGSFTILIGSNGSGKSTLLKSMARLLKPQSGEVTIDDINVFKSPTKKIAKILSILPQSPHAPEELTVFNLVKQGRYPHQSFLQQFSKHDEEVINNALNLTGVYSIRNKKLNELSGGQLQRAWIALTLVQDTDIILLDEPTNHLDLKYKIEVLDLLKKLNREKGRTIVIVLHDINLACRYADYIVAIKNGNVSHQGKPNEIVNREFIKEVFDMDSTVITDPIFNSPLVIAY